MIKQASLTPVANYKITEQDTGTKWIDGRTIYSKTYNMGALATGTVSQPHGITGLDFVLEYKGYVKRADTLAFTIPRVYTDLTNYGLYFDKINGANLEGYVGLGYTAGLAITESAVTIYYLKV